MDLYQVKWLAVISMIIDHIGYFLMPQLTVLRVIGRLAFPLYAYFFCVGVEKTRSKLNYGKRLLILAIITQLLIYSFVDKYKSWNIIFLFLICLISLATNKNKNQWEIRGECLIISLFAYLINIDYQAYGVILVFSIFYKDWFLWIIGGIVAIFSFKLESIVFIFWWIIPYLNKMEAGKNWKGFYLIYPLQFVIFGLISK